MDTIYKILLQSLMAFAALFLIAKINGKKQIAQLAFIDYVIGISIGSIAAEMASDTDTPYYYFLISMFAFLLLDLAVAFLSRKAVWLKFLLNGKPLILIEDGQLNYKNVKKSKLDLNELFALCRIKGFFDLKDISSCILEINGEISILPAAHAVPVVIQDIKTEFKKPELSIDMVIDGKIIDTALHQADKTTEWLLEQLHMTGKKEVKQVFLAVYDEANDSVTVHMKN